MEMKFYKCPVCGQIVAVVKKTGVPVMCCGKPMQEMTVGAAEHPMLPEHYIEWIALQTAGGTQRKALKPGMEPKACFSICDGDAVEAVLAYCNLHSLWKA